MLNFNSDFLTNLPDENTIISALDIISNTDTTKIISAIPFGTESNIDELFDNPHNSLRQIIKVKYVQGVSLYKILHINKNDEKIDREGYFIIYCPSVFHNVYIAFTLEDSDFFRNEMKPLLSSYFSIIFPIIKSSSLKELIEQFKYRNNISELKIKRASHILLKDNNKNSFPSVTWPKMSLEEAFAWAKENNGWFKSIQFDAIRHSKTIANIYVNRDGIIRTDRNFEMIYNSFVYLICKSIDSSLKQFKDRDRRSNKNLDAKPLVIEFDSEIFKNISENKTFINALSKLGNASVSTLHGNPYIHLSIIDYFDGSTFDLWVLSNNEIILVPQMRGTIASIKRIINHIFDTFAEGEIKDYQVTYE